MTRSALFDLLYDDREDGGPLSGTEMIDVMLHMIKPQFAKIGLRVCHDGRWGHDRYYWAEPMSLPKALEAAE